MSLHLLLAIVLMTNACAQSGKTKQTLSPNTKTNKTETPLVDIHSAVLTGQYDIVKQHIDAGTNINLKEPMSGATPIMSAITFNQIEIAELLINRGPDLTLKNNDGSSPLHIAAFFGRIEIVQLLIDAKADKTIKNRFGATPRETVLGDFAQVKPIYIMIIQQLKPMGFELDLEEVKKARPVIAMMLQ
jgi:ankyrin repeat protein